MSEDARELAALLWAGVLLLVSLRHGAYQEQHSATGFQCGGSGHQRNGLVDGEQRLKDDNSRLHDELHLGVSALQLDVALRVVEPPRSSDDTHLGEVLMVGDVVYPQDERDSHHWPASSQLTPLPIHACALGLPNQGDHQPDAQHSPPTMEGAGVRSRVLLETALRGGCCISVLADAEDKLILAMAYGYREVVARQDGGCCLL